MALASAGSFLCQSLWTFERYLEEYERIWNINPKHDPELPEYQNCTLYTTWLLSYARLEKECLPAANLLKLVAYFDNHNLSYGLFSPQDDRNIYRWQEKAKKAWHTLCGTDYSRLPSWLLEITTAPDVFDSAVRVLVQYCFVDVHLTSQTYSIHQCVHDWTLNSLNETIDRAVYWYAFGCVVNLIPRGEWELLAQSQCAPMVPHAVHLTHTKFQSTLRDIKDDRVNGAVWIAWLLIAQVQLDEAEQMYLRALSRCEKVLKPNHTSTLTLAGDLGNLYVDQGKLDKAEQVYERTLAGYERVLGLNHNSTLLTVSNLGLVYSHQGKLDKAEHMYVRALAGYEKASKQDCSLTLRALYNLGLLYIFQGKPQEAELILARALTGCEKALGPDHALTLFTIHSIGILYYIQGKLHDSERMLERAQDGMNKTLGQDNYRSLIVVIDRANLCVAQGKQQDAKQFYLQASAAYAKTVSHTKRPPITLIIRYAEGLCNSIKLGDSAPVAQSQLADLIHLVRKWAAEDRFIFHWLAKALFSIGDDKNARLAVIQSVNRRSEVLDFAGAPCSGCHRRLTLEMGLHVCRECTRVQLCNNCLSTSADNALNQPTFCEHRFCDFGAIVREMLEPSDIWDEHGFNAWISELIVQYPATGGSQRNNDE